MNDGNAAKSWYFGKLSYLQGGESVANKAIKTKIVKYEDVKL